MKINDKYQRNLNELINFYSHLNHQKTKDNLVKSKGFLKQR